MNALIEYTLPVRGLGDGIHSFSFSIDGNFFRHFEDSPIADGKIELEMEMDKRPGTYVLEFKFSGTVRTACDRCLEAINLPVAGEDRLLVKHSLEEREQEAEIVYVQPDIQTLNVAQFVYEFIILAMPMIKVYDCENDSEAPCNDNILDYLNNEPEVEEEDTTPNPIWDELKKFNNKN